MLHTFEVYDQGQLIFYSQSHWLQPLFEFEEFLRSNKHKTELLEIKDKIIGRAAALLLVRLGIKKIQAQLLSELGREVLEYYHLDYKYDDLVKQIGCQTEEILRNEYNPEKAYHIIRQRIAQKINRKP